MKSLYGMYCNALSLFSQHDMYHNTLFQSSIDCKNVF